MKWKLLSILVLFAAISQAQDRPKLRVSVTSGQTPCTVNCTSMTYNWGYTNPPPGWVDCGPKYQISCFKGFMLTIVYNGTETWSFGTNKLGVGALSYHFVPGKELKNGTYTATLVALGMDSAGEVTPSLPATITTHYHGKQE